MCDISLFLKMKVVNRSTSIVVNRSTSVSDVTQFLVQNSKKKTWIVLQVKQKWIICKQEKLFACYQKASFKLWDKLSRTSFTQQSVVVISPPLGKKTASNFVGVWTGITRLKWKKVLFFSTSMMETTQLHFQK